MIKRNGKTYATMEYIQKTYGYSYPWIYTNIKDRLKIKSTTHFCIDNIAPKVTETKSIKTINSVEEQILKKMIEYIGEAKETQSCRYFALQTKTTKIIYWNDTNLIEIYKAKKIYAFYSVNEFLGMNFKK
jgi:hypothetical protein